MDKEQIEKRIADLHKQFEQVQARGNALIGAIQDSEYWLKQIQASADPAALEPARPMELTK